MDKDIVYSVGCLLFGIGGMVDVYLTYTTENTWISFFWLCFGFFVGSFISLLYKLLKFFHKEEVSKC